MDIGEFIIDETGILPEFIEKRCKSCTLWFKNDADCNHVVSTLNGTHAALDSKPISFKKINVDLPRHDQTRWHNTKWIAIYGLRRSIQKQQIIAHFSKALEEPVIDELGQITSWGEPVGFARQQIHYVYEGDRKLVVFIELSSHEQIARVRERLLLNKSPNDDNEAIKDMCNYSNDSRRRIQGSKFWIQMADVPKGRTRCLRIYNLPPRTNKEIIMKTIKKSLHWSHKVHTLKEHQHQQQMKLWDPTTKFELKWVTDLDGKKMAIADIECVNWNDADQIVVWINQFSMKEWNGKKYYKRPFSAIWVHDDNLDQPRNEELQGTADTVIFRGIPQSIDDCPFDQAKKIIIATLEKRHGQVHNAWRLGKQMWKVKMENAEAAKRAFGKDGNIRFRGEIARVGYSDGTEKRVKVKLTKEDLRKMKRPQQSSGLSKAKAKENKLKVKFTGKRRNEKEKKTGKRARGKKYSSLNKVKQFKLVCE